MKFIYIILLVFITICSITNLPAQINAGNDITICKFSSATLTAQVTNQPGATVYQFNNISYSPEPFNGTSVFLGDDAVTSALPIGFQFCFIGNSYTQFYIGSNGWISFSPSQPTTYVSQAIPSTNPSVPKNCIMAPWMDWDPSAGGQIYYKTIGTAPNRKLVVSYVNVPLYGTTCTSTQGTFQIVLEEGTNIINNFIQNKPICSGGAGGSLTATQGVHDMNGTVAYTVPGRNNTQWTATNEGTQFMPTGPALFSVTWHNLSGTQVGSGTTFNVSPPNTTTYVAKVIYNCSQLTFYDTVVVNVAPQIAATNSIVHVSCNGASDGSVTVNVTGGSTPYTYNWSTTPPQNTATASNLSAGNYIVTVTDAAGCTTMKTAVVNQPNPIVANVSKKDPSCSGANDGDATANAVGGVAPFTYLWSDGQTTAKAVGLTNGTYTVTVTDNTGCEKILNITLTAPPPFNINLSAINPSCNGGTGSITATPASGTAPFTFSWSNGANGSTVSGLTAGTYTVTVTDAAGCSNTANSTLSAPGSLSATANVKNADCAGSSTGEILLTMSNGNAPYTFAWSNGSTSNPAVGLSAGNYSVTVTDATGCVFSSSHVVSEPTAITINLSTVDPTCSGTANGSVTASASGGTGPYSYNWNNGVNAASNNNISSGTYTVTVTDSKGCTKTTQVVLNAASAITTNLVVDQITCNGANNGSATINPTGGAGISSITWSNGQSGNTLSGLTPGNYAVTVTDNNGCTKTENFSLQDPPAMVLTFNKNNVSCFSGSDGNINVLPNNGTPPFSYNWNNGGNNSSLTNIPAGSYIVTVTDSKGCAISSSVLVSQPQQLQVLVSTDSVLCNGESNGKATVSVTGGATPYTYAWSNGQSSNIAASLAAAQYTVTVTDNNNCTATAVADVGEPDGMTSTIIVTDENCIAEDGSTAVTVVGGNAPYTYLWQNGNTSSTATDLSAGSYDITVTDANGCEHISTAVIARTGGITADSEKKDITCHGFDNGSITLSVTGGTHPLSYNWSNGSYDSSLFNLAKGSYSVTISDNFGCKDSLAVQIVEPPLLALQFTNVEDASCFGFEDGFAEVTVTGGVVPYNYFWSTGDSLTFASSLAADVYTLMVSDSNGCTISDSIEIKQPEEILIDMMPDTTLPFGSRLRLSASVTPPSNYSYTWTPAIDVLDNNNILMPVAQPYVTTIFILSVKENATGCVVSDSVNVIVKDPRQFWIATAFSPNGDGINDILESKGNNLQYFSMSVYNRWGKRVFATTDINNSWDGIVDGEKAPVGTYVYKAFVIDEWGVEHNMSGSITLLR